MSEATNMARRFDLRGRRALVTGASRGIGRAIALGLAGDCVGAALLLCSDAGAYITGVDLPVDGGMKLP